MGGSIHIQDRSTLNMSDVSEVLEFDEDFISVMTSDGKVEIEGGGMRILNMSSDSGNLLLQGRIDGVYYSVKPSKKRLFGKAVK
ncbi:MAG: YabP/YqfC family sporulation protein [Clostridia bacterium]|nr:YabP/YqfC family sporulation protein [Clostridia bacterium]